MKKITAVLLFVFCSTGLFAQQPADSVSFPPPVNAPAKSATGISKFHFSAEFTFNGLNGLPADISNTIFSSMGFAINAQRKFFLVKNNFYFSTGLGIATYDYATNAIIRTTPGELSKTSYFYRIPDSVHYSKNKLNLVWLQVPLEFHLETSPNSKGNQFNFELGARLGYLINDHTKQKGTDSLGTYKVKTYEIANLNQFSAMITAKIGYDHFNLFAYYNIEPLFVANDIETANELGAGIALTF